MRSSYAILHDVEDASQWPFPVKQFAELLNQPLPAYIATGPYPFVSTRASDLVRELAQSTSQPIEQDASSDCLRSSPLANVFDTVLSTVFELRDLAKIKGYGFPCPTVPLWSSLIQSLAFAVSEDLCVLSEVPFILSRGSLSDTQEDGPTDGLATILVSRIIDKLDGSQLQSQMTTDTNSVHNSFSGLSMEGDDDEDHKHEQDHSQLHDEDGGKEEEDDDGGGFDTYEDYIMNGLSESSTTTRSTSPSINLPFDAHMLPGSGKRYCAVLPVICVADSDNIIPLLTSVLYQRRVWGIAEPAVGMLFAESGTIGRVILGWLDSDSSDALDLPTAHFACATADSVPSPSLGIYDLTDPASALALAQFIFALESHLHAITTSTLSPQIGTLSWRLDHISIDDQISNKGTRGEQWKDRVAEWTRGIGFSDDSSDDSSYPHTPSPETYMSPKSLPPVSENGDDGSPGKRASGKESKRKNIKAPSIEGTAESGNDEKITSEDKSSKSVKSRISSSSLGNRSAKGLADKLTISTWAFERAASMIACISLKPDTQDNVEINSMIDRYNDMTNFLWSPDWASEDSMPFVDGSLLQVRKHLLRQYKEVSAAAGVLNKVHTRIIADRLSLLLSTTVGAFTLAARAAGRPVYEAESRHDWDALLYRFYVGTDEIISPNVLLEWTLRFSRNDAVDIDDPNTLVSSQKKLAEEYFDHCTDALTAVRTIDRNIQPQALAALTRAGAFQSQINSLSEDPTKMAEMVKYRASGEPATGNCDAILVTPISDSLTEGQRSGNVGAMKFPVTFNLVQSPQSADQKTPSDSKNKQRGDKGPSQSTDKNAPSDVQNNQSGKGLSGSGPLLSPPPTTTPSSSHTSLLTSEQTRLLDNLLGVFRSESSSAPALEMPNLPVIDSEAPLLPELLVEHKKRKGNETKALNQDRMYLVSAVKFFAAIGIKGHPIFGLVTSGKLGGVIMAWHSSTQNKIYIMERNTRTFDLSSPLQAFHFATFLVRLKTRSEAVRQLFTKKQTELIAKAKKGEFERWTKQMQLEDLGL